MAEEIAKPYSKALPRLPDDYWDKCQEAWETEAGDILEWIRKNRPELLQSPAIVGAISEETRGRLALHYKREIARYEEKLSRVE